MVDAATTSAAATFHIAARWCTALVQQIRPHEWDGPGLGDWSLRTLVGHASRSPVTIYEYLAEPAALEDVADAAAYYALAVRLMAVDPSAVGARALSAGRALGDAPAAGFAAATERASATIRATVGDPLIETICGGMRFSRYLPTRTFELAVHGLDIARATGRPAAPPPEVLTESIALACACAVANGSGPDLLMALTGRISLSPGYSVL